MPTPAKWYGLCSMADLTGGCEMDEAHIILNIFALLAAIAGGWFLFRDIHSNGESVDAAREQSCDAQAEQREAGEALQSVTDGLEESSAAVSDIAGTGQELAGSISDAQSSIGEGQQLITDSQRRLAECEDLIREVRAGASKD